MIKKTGNLNKNKIISRRLFVLVAAKIGLLGIVTSRLYNLQISEKQKYEVLSDKNRIREWKTPPQRGIITDYFNNVIADNQRVYQVHLSLEEVSNFNNSIFKLKNIISLDENEIKKIYEKKEKSKPWDTLVISENLRLFIMIGLLGGFTTFSAFSTFVIYFGTTFANYLRDANEKKQI